MRVVRVHVRGPRRSADPTHTATLRARYESDMARRFERLAKAIEEEVGKRNGFGLMPTGTRAANIVRIHRGEFEFLTREEKVRSFMRWLRRRADAGILEIQRGTPLEQAARRSWQNVYIDTAYQRGIADAGRKLRGAGADVKESWVRGAFNRPVHADRIGIIYTRAFSDLKAITEHMDRRISAILAEGLAEGFGPMDLARKLSTGVRSISRTRAKVLARTEVINAHAEATLNAFEEAQVAGVEVESEFATARDAQVCPECEELEGRTFTLVEARGIIPVHPNCRCAWLPALMNADGLELNRRWRRRRAA